MAGSINMLTGVKVNELSVVKRGANNKRIAMTKSEEKQMEFNDILKSVVETQANGEDKLIEVMRSAGVPDESQQAAVAGFRLMSGFRDQLTDETMESVAKAAGYDLAKAKKVDDTEDDEVEDMENDELPFYGKKKKKKDMKKTESTMATVEELQKKYDEQECKIVELQKSLDSKDESIKAKDAEIDSIKKSAARSELIVECEKEFAHVPGLTYEEMADTLIASSEAVAKTLRKSWKETSEAVSKSELLKTVGRRATSDGSSTSIVKIENLVSEKVAKSAGNITSAKAWDLVMRENPELYREYLQENPSQTGSR